MGKENVRLCLKIVFNKLVSIVKKGLYLLMVNVLVSKTAKSYLQIIFVSYAIKATL